MMDVGFDDLARGCTGMGAPIALDRGFVQKSMRSAFQTALSTAGCACPSQDTRQFRVFVLTARDRDKVVGRSGECALDEASQPLDEPAAPSARQPGHLAAVRRQNDDRIRFGIFHLAGRGVRCASRGGTIQTVAVLLRKLLGFGKAPCALPFAI